MPVVEVSLVALAAGLVALIVAALGYFLSRFKLEARSGNNKEQIHRQLQRVLRGLPTGMQAKAAHPLWPRDAGDAGAASEVGAPEPSPPESSHSELAPAEPMAAAPHSSEPLRAASRADRLSRSTGRDRMYGEIVAGGLRVMGASVIGSSHEKAGQPREDAFYWRELATGGLVTAIADGVGSTRHAQVAAGLAVRYVVDEVAGHIASAADGRHWRVIADSAVRLAVSHLQPEVVDDVARRHSSYPVPAEKRERSPACTLLVALLIPESRGLSVYWATVGDSQLLSRDAHRSPAWRIETGGETDQRSRGRYLSNATESLPRDLGKVAVGHKLFEPGTLVLLATDGFIRTLEIRSSPADPFVTAEQLRSITPDAFFAAVDEPLPQCWDDRTAVLIQTPAKAEQARPGYFWWGF